MPRRRLLSFKYAFQGLWYLFRTQPNARIHLAALIVAVSAGLFFSISPLEWAAVALASALVLSMEALNTAIEALTDLVSPDYHPLAGRAKDLAAGAVLLSAIGAAVVGGIVFLPKIWAFWE